MNCWSGYICYECMYMYIVVIVCTVIVSFNPGLFSLFLAYVLELYSVIANMTRHTVKHCQQNILIVSDESQTTVIWHSEKFFYIDFCCLLHPAPVNTWYDTNKSKTTDIVNSWQGAHKTWLISVQISTLLMTTTYLFRNLHPVVMMMNMIRMMTMRMMIRMKMVMTITRTVL